MKNIIKVFLVISILAGCTTPYQETGSSGGHGETQKDIIKSGSRQQGILDQAGRLRVFLFLYCRAYESKNLDKFSTFFAPDATENNKPFHEYLPRYRRNFKKVKTFKYRIDLDSYSLDADTGNINLKGKYFIRYLLKNRNWKENSGIISMELIEKGNSYLVKRLNYYYLSLE
jgi:hypothetical protein